MNKKRKLEEGIRLMVDEAAGWFLKSIKWDARTTDSCGKDGPHGRGICVMFLAEPAGQILVSFTFFGSANSDSRGVSLYFRPEDLKNFSRMISDVANGAHKLIRESRE